MLFNPTKSCYVFLGASPKTWTNFMKSGQEDYYAKFFLPMGRGSLLSLEIVLSELIEMNFLQKFCSGCKLIFKESGKQRKAHNVQISKEVA